MLFNLVLKSLLKSTNSEFDDHPDETFHKVVFAKSFGSYHNDQLLPLVHKYQAYKGHVRRREQATADLFAALREGGNFKKVIDGVEAFFTTLFEVGAGEPPPKKSYLLRKTIVLDCLMPLLKDNQKKILRNDAVAEKLSALLECAGKEDAEASDHAFNVALQQALVALVQALPADVLKEREEEIAPLLFTFCESHVTSQLKMGLERFKPYLRKVFGLSNPTQFEKTIREMQLHDRIREAGGDPEVESGRSHPPTVAEVLEAEKRISEEMGLEVNLLVYDFGSIKSFTDFEEGEETFENVKFNYDKFFAQEDHPVVMCARAKWGDDLAKVLEPLKRVQQSVFSLEGTSYVMIPIPQAMAYPHFKVDKKARWGLWGFQKNRFEGNLSTKWALQLGLKEIDKETPVKVQDMSPLLKAIELFYDGLIRPFYYALFDEKGWTSTTPGYFKEPFEILVEGFETLFDRLAELNNPTLAALTPHVVEVLAEMQSRFEEVDTQVEHAPRVRAARPESKVGSRASSRRGSADLA